MPNDRIISNYSVHPEELKRNSGAVLELAERSLKEHLCNTLSKHPHFTPGCCLVIRLGEFKTTDTFPNNRTDLELMMVVDEAYTRATNNLVVADKEPSSYAKAIVNELIGRIEAKQPVRDLQHAVQYLIDVLICEKVLSPQRVDKLGQHAQHQHYAPFSASTVAASVAQQALRQQQNAMLAASTPIAPIAQSKQVK